MDVPLCLIKHYYMKAFLSSLTFTFNIFDVIPNYNQQDATCLDLFISTDALHVSGGSSTHHQEHISVHTASGIVNQYCCLLQQAAVLVDNT